MSSHRSFFANTLRIILTLVFLLPFFAPTSAAASVVMLEGVSHSIEVGQVPDGLTAPPL